MEDLHGVVFSNGYVAPNSIDQIGNDGSSIFAGYLLMNFWQAAMQFKTAVLSAAPFSCCWKTSRSVGLVNVLKHRIDLTREDASMAELLERKMEPAEARKQIYEAHRLSWSHRRLVTAPSTTTAASGGLARMRVSHFRRTCEAEPRSHIYQVGQ